MKGGFTSYMGLLFGISIAFVLYGLYVGGSNGFFDIWKTLTTCQDAIGICIPKGNNIGMFFINMVLGSLTSGVGIISTLIIVAGTLLGQFSMIYLIPLAMLSTMNISSISKIRSYRYYIRSSRIYP